MNFLFLSIFIVKTSENKFQLQTLEKGNKDDDILSKISTCIRNVFSKKIGFTVSKVFPRKTDEMMILKNNEQIFVRSSNSLFCETF